MAQRRGGSRRKTRYKLSRTVKERGKISISALFKTLNMGDIVVLKPNPAIQKGAFPFDFVGKHGVIIAKKGKCYELVLKDGGKRKRLIVHPAHLKKC